MLALVRFWGYVASKLKARHDIWVVKSKSHQLVRKWARTRVPVGAAASWLKKSSLSVTEWTILSSNNKCEQTLKRLLLHTIKNYSNDLRAWWWTFAGAYLYSSRASTWQALKFLQYNVSVHHHPSKLARKNQRPTSLNYQNIIYGDHTRSLYGDHTRSPDVIILANFDQWLTHF